MEDVMVNNDLSIESLKLLKMFQRRFGNKYNDDITKKFSQVEVNYCKRIYYNWWGSVDKERNVFVNSIC